MPSEKKVVVKPVEATKDMEKALSPPPSPPADGSPGAWGDGCCNCFSDCCICCANCWCPCFTVAQVYVRAMNKPQQFGVICALLWVLYIAYQVSAHASDPCLCRSHADSHPQSSGLAVCAGDRPVVQRGASG